MRLLSLITAGLIAIGLSAPHALGQFHPDLDRPLPGTVESDQPAQTVDPITAASVRQLTHIALTGDEWEQVEALEKIVVFGQDAAMSAAKIRPLLDAPSADVSHAAAEALDAMGPAACPQWLEAAKSPDGFTRMLALEALRNRQLKIRKINLGDLRAVLDANLKDASRQVRIPAAKALLRFWPASAPEIMEAIKHHDRDVREVMLEGLWFERKAYLGETPFRDLGSGSRLVDAQPDRQVLLEIGREFEPELLVRLGSNDERIRQWAIDIINQLPPEAISDSLAKNLAKQMKDRDPAIAVDAAQLLTHLGDNAVPGLIEGAGSKDDTVQWVCINALANRTTAKSSPAAIAVLRNALASPRWPIRKRALEWVDKLDAPPDGVVEILARGLTPNQPDSFNSAFAFETAVAALGRFAVKPKLSVPAILGALESDDQTQTLNAIRALRAFGPDAGSAVPKLITLLEKYPDIASDTTATLAALSPKGRKAAAAYYVNQLANAPNADIRMEAVRALAPLADEAGDAAPILGKLLASDDNMLRIDVARTLSQLGPKAAGTKPALIRMMDNRDAEIRAAAADALVKIAPDGAGLSPALMAAVYNGDRSATNRLAATIQRAGDTDALIRKLNDVASDDPEPAVRAAAMHAVECLALDAGPASATQPGK